MANRLPTRPLGTTGLDVSEVGFGGFAIGGNHTGNSYGPTDDIESVDAVRAALDQGCTFFDTADVYGFGHGEEVLAEGLGALTSEVVVATKVGGRFDTGVAVPDHSAAHIRSSVDDSLRRLRRDHIDLYQLHDPPIEVIRSGEAFGALRALVEAGKITAYGASVHTPAEALACLEDDDLGALQIPYNMLSLVDSTDAWDAVFDASIERGVGVIAREPLANGFLSGRHTSDTHYGDGDNRGRLDPDRRALLCGLVDALRPIVGNETSLVHAALRFVLAEPAVSTVIVGMKTVAQVRENLAAVEPLAPSDRSDRSDLRSRSDMSDLSDVGAT